MTFTTVFSDYTISHTSLHSPLEGDVCITPAAIIVTRPKCNVMPGVSAACERNHIFRVFPETIMIEAGMPYGPWSHVHPFHSGLPGIGPSELQPANRKGVPVVPVS